MDAFAWAVNAIGYFLHKGLVVLWAFKYLLRDIDDSLCMVVVLCKDKSLWDIVHIRLSVGIELGIDNTLELFKDCAYLHRIYNILVQTLCLIVNILCGFPYFLFIVISIMVGCCIALVDRASTLCRHCVDAVCARSYVNAISNTLFKSIVNDHVIIEESQCLRHRSCRKTDDASRVKIFQDLSPTAIYRAMTLVNDYYVKIVV